ncbi:restriction endonuclease subunit S [Bifidobacterium apri]|uniref:restriction endonuclease subunit S n=1 Tax=Bifidobacterium apri TaxID=1769423 RepID=UPI00399640F8
MAKKNSKKTVPDLRFRGFTDPWEQRQLGEVGLTYPGLSGKTKEDFGHGDARFVTYMNVYSNAVANPDGVEAIEKDDRQHEVMNGDVFFTGSSETPDEVGLSSVWLGNSTDTYLNSFCFGYRPSKQLDSLFLASSLRSPQMRSRIILLAQGISRFNISKTQVMQLPLCFPSLPEQRRIGDFFSTLDSLIAAAERQETLLRQKKQAYLQLMFPQEGETEPRLRFSGFIQNWRMHRMSEMVAPLNSIQQIMPDRDIEYRLWSVPSFQLGVPENVRGSRIMSSKLVLERDDILLSKINPRIQRIWRVDSDGTLPDVGSTEWVVFRAKPSKASPLFLKALLSSPLFYRYMVSTEKGATGSQKRADKTLLMSSCYWLPSLSEQQRIGAFFHLVDATLLTVQRNLAGLKELKRAYLQRMFI